MRRDDGAHGARVGGHEERRADALDKRDHRDQPERIRVQRDDDNEDAHSDDAHGVRADHQPLPVPAVGHDPCRQREERVRDRAREEHEAGHGRRAREREHEQRIGDRRQPRPDVRQQLPGLEQHEVAVSAQGNRVHGTTLSGSRSGRAIASIAPGPPLPTPLSQLLIAFTIEFDNELDHRLTEADVGRRLPISMVMWSNFLRFVGDGITVGELPEATGIPKSRTLSTLGGLERWRYVFVSAKPTGPLPRSRSATAGAALERSSQSGSSAPRRRPAGRRRRSRRPLFGEIERCGGNSGSERRRSMELRQALAHGDRRARRRAARVPPDRRQHERDGRRDRPPRGRDDCDAPVGALAQVLLAYTLDFEREVGAVVAADRELRARPRRRTVSTSASYPRPQACRRKRRPWR